MYKTDVVISTKSWLKEDLSSAEAFKADFTTFRRERSARGVWIFIRVKSIIAPTELWVDDDFEIVAVEKKEVDPKYSYKIIGIYRAPNQDILAIERLATRTLPARNLMMRSIIGGDLNLPQADSKGEADKASGFQAMVNSLVWDNGYTKVVSGPTRVDALLYIYLLRPGSSLISCNILPGISDHNGFY